MKSTIDPSEISVVVRGLVNPFTKRSLESVRATLPGAQIIFSTWKGQDTAGLEYDELVTSEQPPAVYMARSDDPTQVKLMTGNNQIVASRNGLAVATRPYTIVTRTDIVLTGTGFIDLFLKYNRGQSSGIFKKKVVMLPTYNPRRAKIKLLFSACDWFYFGLKEDLCELFNIPLFEEQNALGEKKDGHYAVSENFEAEQYLWSTFIKEHYPIDLPSPNYFSQASLRESERSYAQNTIMAPATMVNVLCLKMPHAGYSARPILSQGLYTFNDYLKLCRKYDTHPVRYVPNPLEDIVYRTILGTRFLLRRIAPSLYGTVIGFIRARRTDDNASQ